MIIYRVKSTSNINYIVFIANSSQLQVSWIYPTADVAQVYECHVTGVTHTGSRDVTSGVHVTNNDVTLDLLVSAFICSLGIYCPKIIRKVTFFCQA